jgi:hypothetical protein
MIVAVTARLNKLFKLFFYATKRGSLEFEFLLEIPAFFRIFSLFLDNRERGVTVSTTKKATALRP